jgi:signal transduction histidine kinase
MLKNIFSIPDTFDPDDHRRRQIINLASITIIFIAFLIGVLSLLVIYYDLDPNGSIAEEALIIPIISTIVVCSILTIATRLSKVSSWFNGMALVIFITLVISQSDTTQQLYNGRSLVMWVIPIMLTAVMLRPGYAFVVSTTISGLIWIFHHNPDGSTNYYSVMALFLIASISWLTMTIANNAIRDAHREAANNKAILENMGEGLLVLDLQGKLLSANQALLNMIPEEELKEILVDPLGKTLQWKRRIYSIIASQVPEVGMVAVFRDETRRHETERARDALIAIASHELRTPLAATMNYLELTLMLIGLGKVNMEEFKENLTRALENSRRLQGLVDNILDQAQIQAGVLELKNRLFNLPSLFEKTRQLLEVLIQQKNLSYELKIAADVPSEILGDADRLHQVLVNLIGNAIKFTNQGGIKVRISAPQKETLSIEVADTGAGIPPEQLPDIFETFRRGSNYAQRERQGAGLGLSIAKEIVTRMGGEIQVASEPGKGSTFTVSIPFQPA